MYSIKRFTTSPTQVGRWTSLRRASKLPKMLGHPLKGVNQDFLPLDAGTRRGEGRIALILDRINITKMSYVLTKIFQHPICVKLCQRLSLSRLSTKPQAHLCTHSQVVDVLVPVNGDRKISVSNEHTSTQQFYTRFSSILTEILLSHQNTLFGQESKKNFRRE